MQRATVATGTAPRSRYDNPVPPTARRVADLIVEQLAIWGVQRIYGAAGDAILPFLDAVARHGGLRFVAVRHEETAALMASAHAKLTGQLGVCLATSGPGVAHLVNGLADAYTDKAPVLAISGQVETYYIGTDQKQYIDQQVFLQGVTGYSAQLNHPRATVAVMVNALKTALRRRTVAHVAVPKDIWTETVDLSPSPPEPYIHTPARSDPYVLREAAAILARAERPMFLVGLGCKGAIGQVMVLAERVGAGVIYTLGAAGLVPGEHRLVIGGLGEGGSEAATELLHMADWVFRAGANWWPKRFVPEDIHTLDLDIRPEHVGNGRAATYGAVGDTRSVLPSLLEHVPYSPKPKWEATLAARRNAWRAAAEHEQVEETSPIPPARIMRALQQTVPLNAVIALDVGDHVLWFNRHFRGSGQQDILVSGTWRTMGFALPAVMAAKLSDPARPALAVAGDGGFGMLMADFTTAVRERLPVTVLIFNNGALAMEKYKALAGGMKAVGVDLHNPNFAAFAKACGGFGLRVTRPTELEPALRQAFNAGQPTLVDIITADLPVPTVQKVAQEPALPGA